MWGHLERDNKIVGDRSSERGNKEFTIVHSRAGAGEEIITYCLVNTVHCMPSGFLDTMI